MRMLCFSLGYRSDSSHLTASRSEKLSQSDLSCTCHHTLLAPNHRIMKSHWLYVSFQSCSPYFATNNDIALVQHVVVQADVVDSSSGSQETTNDFRFTWRSRSQRTVAPRTYKGTYNPHKFPCLSQSFTRSYDVVRRSKSSITW
jgi:hypothetical protein